MLLAVCAIVSATFANARAEDSFNYVANADQKTLAGAIIIDSRPLVDCRQATLPNARCLPAEDFLGPHRRLPGDRDILWLLGTVGLDGSETVLVVGQDAIARDFVAGLLYLAGQRHVRVLTEPLTRVLAGRSDGAPGQQRGIIRSAVFVAPMRDERVVLRHEILREAAGETLLDGRSELEYWGETVRGARGGHLPGAVQWQATTLAVAGPRPLLPSGAVIAYAHDAYEGLAYFTRLVAGFGLQARIYSGGWAEWAAEGSLPIVAASYPERRVEAPAAVSPAPTFGASPVAMALAAAAVLAAFSCGWYFSRKQVA
ncbi:MAG: hypothetical protein K9J74_03595 [Sulfuritalea sp.]|nr:hypothetical protein [Sulfuritalea sp.]